MAYLQKFSSGSKACAIAIFIYNRPAHTSRTLDSICKCVMFDDSPIYIFCDGPKSVKDFINVKKAREELLIFEGYSNVHIELSTVNLGLANSVIHGVTKVLEDHNQIIVLEDDLLFGKYFIYYMNMALNLYETDKRVYSVGGYTPNLRIPRSYQSNSFLSYRCCSWGWGTWRDRWTNCDWSIRDYDSFVNSQSDKFLFNRGGNDMSDMLQLQMEGKIDSWAIRWDYAHFRNNAYCLRPIVSLVSNIGLDNSGTHCGTTTKFDVLYNHDTLVEPPLPNELLFSKHINNQFAYFYDGTARDASTLVFSYASKAFRLLRKGISQLTRSLANIT